MAINVSVRYRFNGGLLPDSIPFTRYDYIGEPFRYHVQFLSLEPMFPPKYFDNLPVKKVDAQKV